MLQNSFLQQFVTNYYCQPNMSDFQQFSKVLYNWKDHDKKNILQILKRVDSLNLQKQDGFNLINKGIFDFHKQIQNSDRDLIDSEWFSYIIKIKKKLKKILQTTKHKQEQKPILVKKPSASIQYSSQLFQDIRSSEKDLVKILFKNFVFNMPSLQQIMKDKRTINFIKEVNKQLRIMFEDQLDVKKNKRVDSICMHLSKQGAIGAKFQMLQGKKSAKQVALDNQSAFMDQQTQRKMQQHLKEQFQMSQTGFYDEMKKNIFKGASQQCRFCHKQSAYCDDMKQIRASDEPMTRFMKCNNCGKNWRD